MNEYELTADKDFRKARKRASLQSIFSKFRWKADGLLPFYEVTELIKPKSETYKGVIPIRVDRIIGSENRFNDFSRDFYPKRDMLRRRWENIDSLNMRDVELPPISVYGINGWYFVRDGNHRVSVAKSTGVAYIDAEVVELTSEIDIKPGMTLYELRKKAVQYERNRFMQQYKVPSIPMGEIAFTSPGSYAVLANHIMVHKYYMNQNIPDREVTFEEAFQSWYENVWSRILKAIRDEHLLSEFPGHTEGDMYLWIADKWDSEKRNEYNGEDISTHLVAKEFEKENKKGRAGRWFRFIKEEVSPRK